VNGTANGCRSGFPTRSSANSCFEKCQDYSGDKYVLGRSLVVICLGQLKRGDVLFSVSTRYGTPDTPDISERPQKI
jgi:hypothetical protein